MMEQDPVRYALAHTHHPHTPCDALNEYEALLAELQRVKAERDHYKAALEHINRQATILIGNPYRSFVMDALTVELPKDPPPMTVPRDETDAAFELVRNAAAWLDFAADSDNLGEADRRRLARVQAEIAPALTTIKDEMKRLQEERDEAFQQWEQTELNCAKYHVDEDTVASLQSQLTETRDQLEKVDTALRLVRGAGWITDTVVSEDERRQWREVVVPAIDAAINSDRATE